MKHILFVKDMTCDKCVKKISAALEQADIKFNINISQKSITVEGRGDVVVETERILQDLGYEVL